MHSADMGNAGLTCEWKWVTVSVALSMWPHLLSPQDEEQAHWWRMYKGDLAQLRRVQRAV